MDIKMENKNKKINKLSESEIAELTELVDVYKKFKMLTRLGKWLILFILAVIFEGSRAIDTIDNIIMHLKRWFAKI